MKTVGEILKSRREELKLSLSDIERETKIRARFLTAIESNNFSLVAESTVVKGFIRNYASALGLAPEAILAVFRRDFSENQEGRIIPRGVVQPLTNQTVWWTPKLTAISLILLCIVGIGLIFGRQYLKFSSAPALELTSPQESATVAEVVTVSGKTDPNAAVRIDGSLISIDEDGTFSEKVVLPRGENLLVIESVNRQGKRTVINRKVRAE